MQRTDSPWLIVVGIVMWLVFFTVRIQEGHFGPWSSVFLFYAILGPKPWITFGKFVRDRFPHKPATVKSR